ncbi:MAG TPA: hypothetical protein VLY85_01865 [Thermoplasmata archaeon]|nr:hypothetical protein [Thermoplasmata archaeon]
MRRQWIFAGLAVIAVGFVLVVAGALVQSVSTSISIPANSAERLTPSTIGGVSFSASWSGANASTTVYLITGAPTCVESPQGVVTYGTGASGTITATLNSGTSYQLFACNGNQSEPLSASYTSQGITVLMVLGIVVAIAGIVLAILGYRSRSGT